MHTVPGNMMVGEPTIRAMVEAFERAEALDLAEPLLVVLEPGQAAGGDKRGRQSAAIKVVFREEYLIVDLRVDEHRDPVVELRRAFEFTRHQYLPFVPGMPTHANPTGDLPEDLGAMLFTPPADRPVTVVPPELMDQFGGIVSIDPPGAIALRTSPTHRD
jgi:uncharacterized Ntn-hydrolase superfamily protein